MLRWDSTYSSVNPSELSLCRYHTFSWALWSCSLSTRFSDLDRWYRPGKIWLGPLYCRSFAYRPHLLFLAGISHFHTSEVSTARFQSQFICPSNRLVSLQFSTQTSWLAQKPFPARQPYSRYVLQRFSSFRSHRQLVLRPLEVHSFSELVDNLIAQ